MEEDSYCKMETQTRKRSMWLLLLVTLLHFVQGDSEGEIKLTRGSHPWGGYLEIYHSGRWGTVCDDSWGTTESQVVCRQLGYDYGTPSYQGSGSEIGLRTWLDDVNCIGSESRLTSCGSNGWGVENCNNENIRVYCVPSPCLTGSFSCENGGTCVPTGSSATCQCPPSVTGTHCENDVDECATNNGGCSHNCTNQDKTGYTCTCPDELLLSPDQHNCYSAHASVVCTSQSMTLSLERAGITGLHSQFLRTDQPGCPAQDTVSHVIITLPLNGCGTVRYLDADTDEWVYENHVTSHRDTASGMAVSHVRRMNVTVRCRYPHHVTVTESYAVHAQRLAFQQNTDGNFSLSLELEQGGQVYRPGGPALIVDPGAPLTVRVKLNDSRPDLQALAYNCAATPTPDTSDPDTTYNLIQNGCPLDSTLEAEINNGTLAGSDDVLHMQAFKFLGQTGTVFLHCDVLVCNASDPASLCSHSCNSNSNSSSDSASEVISNSDSILHLNPSFEDDDFDASSSSFVNFGDDSAQKERVGLGKVRRSEPGVATYLENRRMMYGPIAVTVDQDRGAGN